MKVVNKKTTRRSVLTRYCWSFISGDCTDLDLGMESGKIPDNNIKTSPTGSQAKNGRLNKAGAWCAETADNDTYLQIDLQTLHIICAVSTQGNSQADQWVESYKLQVSTNGKTWTDYEELGQVRVSLSLSSSSSSSSSPSLLGRPFLSSQFYHYQYLLLSLFFALII